ncbi:MAG: hypothetical protein ACO3VQ_02565 [Ilumatobacteraceae bacterium]
MATYTVTLTDAQDRALRYVAVDPQDWIDNAVHNRCRIAIDQIYQEEVDRMVNDPDITSIPANKEQVVLDADIMSLADRQAQAENEPMV